MRPGDVYPAEAQRIRVIQKEAAKDVPVSIPCQVLDPVSDDVKARMGEFAYVKTDTYNKGLPQKAGLLPCLAVHCRNAGRTFWGIGPVNFFSTGRPGSRTDDRALLHDLHGAVSMFRRNVQRCLKVLLPAAMHFS